MKRPKEPRFGGEGNRMGGMHQPVEEGLRAEGAASESSEGKPLRDALTEVGQGPFREDQLAPENGGIGAVLVPRRSDEPTTNDRGQELPLARGVEAGVEQGNGRTSRGPLEYIRDTFHDLRLKATKTFTAQGKVESLGEEIKVENAKVANVSNEITRLGQSDIVKLVELNMRRFENIAKIHKLTEERIDYARVVVDRLLKPEGAYRAQLKVADTSLAKLESEQKAYSSRIIDFSRRMDELRAQSSKPAAARALNLTANDPAIKKILEIFVGQVKELGEQIEKQNTEVNRIEAKFNEWVAGMGGYEKIDENKDIAASRRPIKPGRTVTQKSHPLFRKDSPRDGS